MKLKVLIDAHVFDYEFQGTRTFLKGMYIALAKLDPNIELIFCSSNPEDTARELQIENAVYIKIPATNSFNRMMRVFPSLINEHKPHFAHFQYILPFIRRPETKYIVTTHDILFKDFPADFPFFYKLPRNILFKKSARKADILTTVSNYSKKKIAEHFSIDEHKITVLPNAVADNYFNEIDSTAAKQYISKKYGINKFILYVSRFEPRKNHARLLTAFDELNLSKEGYSMVFLGKKTLHVNEYDAVFQQLDSSVKEKIFQFDFIEDLDLVKFYAAADLFVYPSLAEGFGIPPLEAAAVGTPVICSNTTAMSDFDFLEQFDPYNTEEIKQKIILELSKNSSGTSTLKEKIKHLYSWEETARIFHNILR